jgi:cytochrome b561/polyisoprenoid-binding protein YceI
MSDAATLPHRTRATNSATTYGWVERAFHWSIALLIPTAAVLGIVAHEWPYATDAELAVKATLFSWHKTTGIVVFLTALLRILWALTQPRPVALHPDRKLETFLAATVHWLLYGALVAVPLTGWIHHASAVGFAPILWPFGQGLPGVPSDPALAELFATLHRAALIVLGASLALHVAGALKHAVIDRDATLARMLRGAEPQSVLEGRHSAILPLAAAVAVWAGALAAGVALRPAVDAPADAPAALPAQAAFEPNWSVEEGTLSITVTQLGQDVTGTFAAWDAAIDYDEATGNGRVEVTVDTGSLTLGSVTSQATGEEFLASSEYPQALFEAAISPAEDGEGHVAEGSLSIREASVPVRLPFVLEIDGDQATMSGRVEVDRRDFAMGTAYGDETTVGFGVSIDVALTARRSE